MGKRANGLGGVSYHRGSGRWRARLTVDGKEVTRYASGQKEAWKLLEDLRRRAADGLSMRADKMTVDAYLTAWLDDVAAVRVRPVTLVAYRIHVRAHIVPAIGQVLLSKLTPGHVQHLIGTLTAGGMLPSSVRQVHATLRTALNHAARVGTITRNVAPLAALPAMEHKPRQALEPEAAAAILRAAKGNRLESLITLAMFAGMRTGELTGLPWREVDLDACRLTVSQALSWIGGRPVLAPPKTARSRRTLPLPSAAVEALRAHRERQRFEQRAAGDAWNNADGLVFVAEDGGPLGKHVARMTLVRCLAAAGLPRMRFHDLRHGFATLAIQSGAGLREIMEGLGHASIGTTANIYAHISPATLRSVADGVERLVTEAGQRPAAGGG